MGYDYQFSKDNLAYLQSWLKVLKNDKRAIFKACSEAQKAFDYLLTFKKQTEKRLDAASFLIIFSPDATPDCYAIRPKKD